MKRLTIVSLVLLALLMSVCVLVISCTCKEKATEPPSQPAPPELPSEPALPEPEEGVYLSPTLIEAKAGQTVSFEIMVKPSGWGMSGCEINLVFSPDIMGEVDIELGDFLGSNPVIGLKQVNNRDGVVRLALARVGETSVPSPPGILATVKFKILDSATSGTYELKLTEIGLADENFQDITGFTVQGASIKISP